MTVTELFRALGLDPAALADGDLSVRSPIDGGEIARLSTDPPAAVDAKIERARQAFLAWRSVPAPVRGEVIGFHDHNTLVSPYGDFSGVRHGSRARLVRTSRYVRVGPRLLGRVVDGHGQPIDGRGPAAAPHRAPLDRTAPSASERPTRRSRCT